MAIPNNFIFFIDDDEECVMYSKSDNVEIMINDQAEEDIKESSKGSKFVFDYVDLLYYKYHKSNLNRGRSYIDSQDKNKKAIINPINKKYNKCFQYVVK